MRLFIKFAIALVVILIPTFGAAQLGFWTDRAVGTAQFNGFTGLVPISYGQVRVCTFPASGNPCTPLATVFDINGNLLPIVGGNFGQVTTDVVGRFSFQAAPGSYLIQVAAGSSNTPALQYPITISPVGLFIPALILTGNNLFTGNNTFSGTTTMNIVNVANLNTILFASQFVGADCGIKIQTAITALVASNPLGGTVVGDFTGGVCSGFTIAPGVTVWLKAGNYGFTGQIRIQPTGAHFIGDGSGNNGGTVIHGQGTSPAAPLVESFNTSGGTYWHDSSIENIRFQMDQGSGVAQPAIHIWNMGQSSSLRNLSVFNSTGAGIKLDGAPVPMALYNISVFGSASYGYDVNFGLNAEESGNTFACYTCTGDDDVPGLYRFQNGNDRSTVLVEGSKGERKINVAEQDPIFTLDHYSGEIVINSFEAFNTTGFPNAADVIKIVDTITPGTPLSPDITIIGMDVRRYNTFINDQQIHTRSVAATGACTQAAPCIIPYLHYARSGQYNYDDINGNRQSFAGSIGSVLNTFQVFGDSFNRLVFRPGSICFGDNSGDPTSPQNCLNPIAGNLGIFSNKEFAAPSLSLNGGTLLTTTNQTGTGLLVLQTGAVLITPNIGGGSTLNFFVRSTDSPGAITVNAATCTDRTVAIAGVTTGASVFLAANYALEANLVIGPAQITAGNAHYRICNVTAGNITLNAAATFNVSVFQ